MIRVLLCSLLSLVLMSTAALADSDVYDIIMYAGADYSLQLNLTDSNGVSLNLTGYTFQAQMRPAISPVSALYTNYSAIVTSPSTGTVMLRLSKAQTRALSGKTGLWDLQQTNPSGAVSYLLRGTVTVQPTVTR